MCAQVVFKNPRNANENVTVTEIECDHSSTWEAALALAGEQKNFCGFFVPRKAPREIFLAIPLDEWRVRLCYPQKLHAGYLGTRWISQNCCKAQPNQMAHCKLLWEKRLELFVKKGAHLERFALLNGSVFSAWHNVREARRSRLPCSPHLPAQRVRDSAAGIRPELRPGARAS